MPVPMEPRQGKDGYISDICVWGRELYENTDFPNNPSILRVIEGPIAEWDRLNRNKRRYTEKLWDRTLESPYVKEQLGYHTLYGELNHPTDRMEVDFDRVSHSIVDMWKVPDKSQIYGKILILNTPSGQILNTLYEAGGVIGYSSRAGGTLTQKKGYVDVDENTYNFVTFDAVPFPSVESARPPVVEGVVQKHKLPDDAHDKICKLISESSTSVRENLKSLIYSLQNYDMSREEALFESIDNPNIEPVVEKELEETTLSLIKESSAQIETLRASNEALKADNASLNTEIVSLRENLSNTLEKLATTVSENNKVEKENESKIRIVENNFSYTIAELKETISELKADILDRDSEIEYLNGVHEAFRAEKFSKRGMKSSSEFDDIKNKVTRLEKELNESCDEISSLLDENNQLSNELEEKSSKVVELEETVSLYEGKIENLALEHSRILESAGSQDSINELSSRIEELEKENENLRSDLKHTEDLLESARESGKEYKDGMIESICSNYGLMVESVKQELSAGFKRSDVYNVCERLSNTSTSGINYSQVEKVEESTHRESVDRSEYGNNNPNTSMISEGLFQNRRGLGKF